MTPRGSRRGGPCPAPGWLMVLAIGVVIAAASVPAAGAGISPDETPGFIAGTLIPVSSCVEGARCSGGADCQNGICVDPCKGSSSPFCQCECFLSGEPEFPWIVVVGGLAAVAAAAAFIALVLKRKPGKKGEPPSESYILQLSKNEVTVSKKTGDSFTVTAWKVTAEGALVPAPLASIRLTPPANLPGLVLSPASGQGSLTSCVSLRTYSGPGTGIITVTASAGGGSVSADVKVQLDAAADIEFD